MAKEKSGNILVLGNGFDLYHGMATKYYDFVEFTEEQMDRALPIYEDSLIIKRLRKDMEEDRREEEEVVRICKRNPFLKYFRKIKKEGKLWIDCEKELAEVVSVISRLLNSKININTEFSFIGNDLQIIDAFPDYFLSSGHNKPYRFSLKFESIQGIVDKDKLLLDVKKDLDEVIVALRRYLQEVYEFSPTEVSPQIEGIQFDYVINFNYTTTIEEYGIAREKISYIHGCLKSNPIDMVLGIADYEEDDLNFIYFKKYFQRIQKKLGVLDYGKFARFDNVGHKLGKEAKCVFFFGHSMSKNDEDLIEDIFLRTKKVVVFYYDQFDYEQKIINLIEIFGKTEVLKWVRDEFIVMTKMEGV